MLESGVQETLGALVEVLRYLLDGDVLPEIECVRNVERDSAGESSLG